MHSKHCYLLLITGMPNIRESMIPQRLRHKFGNVKPDTLVLRVKLVTQELKATSSKVSYHMKKIQ